MKDLVRLVLLAALIAAVLPIQAAAKDVPFVAKTETLRGAISIVDLDNKLVIIKHENGAFFDFQVKPTTKIEVGEAKAKLEDLVNQTGKEAVVTFRMLRTGDVALKIEVQ